MSRTVNAIKECFDLEERSRLEVLRHCNPNRNGILGLVKLDSEYFVVVENIFDYGDGCEESDWDVLDYQSLETATSIYEGYMKDRGDTPNWNAQAEYDEAHGTINGEDAGLVEMRELWGE